jgi:serine protease AprX
LGVRRLNEAGIDGRGIGIAIIDQPLLREHEEYNDCIARYVPVEVEGVPPQMHGPAVASIAVGKTCGVAPKAALYFFAVPMWKWSANKPWAEQLERVVELNRSLTNTPKIRVISISLGAFSERLEFERWQKAVQKATDSGILVLTCDPAALRIATLKRMEDHTGESPADYERGRYVHFGAALGVPAANRTIASCKGPQAFTYDRMGGMSWTVPYLAGLAALAWQVDPTIQPKEMIQLWKQTAVNTEAGLVVNPTGLIEAVKKRR